MFDRPIVVLCIPLLTVCSSLVIVLIVIVLILVALLATLIITLLLIMTLVSIVVTTNILSAFQLAVEVNPTYASS